MTDIVSTPPAPASPAGATIDLGPWWPAIDVNDFRDEYALGGTTIPHRRVVAALEAAAVATIKQLAAWQLERVAEGHPSMGAIAPNAHVGGRGFHEISFLAAVHNHAAAILADKHADLTATREGADRGEQRRDMAGDFRREATHAVRDILGLPRGDVELI